MVVSETKFSAGYNLVQAAAPTEAPDLVVGGSGLEYNTYGNCNAGYTRVIEADLAAEDGKFVANSQLKN